MTAAPRCKFTLRHGNLDGGVETHRSVRPEEICGNVVPRNERGLSGRRVAKRDGLAKFIPRRGWTGAEGASRLLKPANIHPERGIEEILAQYVARDVECLAHPHQFEHRHRVKVADSLIRRDAIRRDGVGQGLPWPILSVRAS